MAAQTVEMAEIAEILGAAGLCIAGFMVWYTRWQRRQATALQRIPVSTEHSGLVVRRGAERPGHSR